MGAHMNYVCVHFIFTILTTNSQHPNQQVILEKIEILNIIGIILLK